MIVGLLFSANFEFNYTTMSFLRIASVIRDTAGASLIGNLNGTMQAVRSRSNDIESGIRCSGTEHVGFDCRVHPIHFRRLIDINRGHPRTRALPLRLLVCTSMLGRLSMLIVRCILVGIISLCVLFCSPSANGDEFKIPFNQGSLRDPLLEWSTPALGPESAVQSTDEGLLIQQKDFDPKDENRSIGFRFMVPTGGDFNIEMDLDSVSIQPPKDGWGQGIVLKANFGDWKKTVVTIGYATRPKMAPAFFASKENTPNNNPIYDWQERKFTRGKLGIKRSKDNVSLLIAEDKSETVLASFPVTTEDVASFEVWCTRQSNKDDTPATYLLKNLYLKGETHFGLRPPKEGISWWTIAVTSQSMLLGVFLFVWYRKRAKKTP